LFRLQPNAVFINQGEYFPRWFLTAVFFPGTVRAHLKWGDKILQ